MSHRSEPAFADDKRPDAPDTASVSVKDTEGAVCPTAHHDNGRQTDDLALLEGDRISLSDIDPKEVRRVLWKIDLVM